MAANRSSSPSPPRKLYHTPVCFGKQVNRICCIGAGKVGILTTLILSRHWPNITFVIVDTNVARINNLNRINPNHEMLFPFEEPSMNILLNENPGLPNVVFSHHITAELAKANVIFIAVDIPLTQRPRQVRQDLDIRNLESAIRSILISMNGNHEKKCVAVKSTLPVDSRGDLHARFSRYHNYRRLHVVSNPEFFSNGSAYIDLTEPVRVVFGRVHREIPGIFQELYMPVVGFNAGLIVTLPTASSAELGKILSNVVMAAQLTVVNIGSSLCENVGGRFHDVQRCLDLNRRHRSSITHTASGFGGLGLNKDVAYAAFLCEQAGLKSESKFFTMLIQQRKEKMDRLVKTILSKIGSVKRIGWFGFSNHSGTDDLRESPAIYILSALLKAYNVTVVIHDPVIGMETIPNSLPQRVRNRVQSVELIDEVTVAHPHAVVLYLDDEVYRHLNFAAVLQAMRPPKHIFDCCGMLDQLNQPDLQYIAQRANVYRLGMPN